jgi:hypothetical protein
MAKPTATDIIGFPYLWAWDTCSVRWDRSLFKEMDVRFREGKPNDGDRSFRTGIYVHYDDILTAVKHMKITMMYEADILRGVRRTGNAIVRARKKNAIERTKHKLSLFSINK